MDFSTNLYPSWIEGYWLGTNIYDIKENLVMELFDNFVKLYVEVVDEMKQSKGNCLSYTWMLFWVIWEWISLTCFVVVVVFLFWLILRVPQHLIKGIRGLDVKILRSVVSKADL